jgi:hypothetical protein
MFQPDQRVQVDLSGLTVQGVSFSQNVRKALGTIVRQVSTDPPTYQVELLFSFRGIKRVEVGDVSRSCKRCQRLWDVESRGADSWT